MPLSSQQAADQAINDAPVSHQISRENTSVDTSGDPVVVATPRAGQHDATELEDAEIDKKVNPDVDQEVEREVIDGQQDDQSIFEEGQLEEGVEEGGEGGENADENEEGGILDEQAFQEGDQNQGEEESADVVGRDLVLNENDDIQGLEAFDAFDLDLVHDTGDTILDNMVSADLAELSYVDGYAGVESTVTDHEIQSMVCGWTCSCCAIVTSYQKHAFPSSTGCDVIVMLYIPRLTTRPLQLSRRSY
jgi:hypothetical protein